MVIPHQTQQPTSFLSAEKQSAIGFPHVRLCPFPPFRHRPPTHCNQTPSGVPLPPPHPQPLPRVGGYKVVPVSPGSSHPSPMADVSLNTAPAVPILSSSGDVITCDGSRLACGYRFRRESTSETFVTMSHGLQYFYHLQVYPLVDVRVK